MTAHYLTLIGVAYILTMLAFGAIAALVDWWRRRKRQVIGTRVRAPEWRARRLTNGQWIVERRKGK